MSLSSLITILLFSIYVFYCGVTGLPMPDLEKIIFTITYFIILYTLELLIIRVSKNVLSYKEIFKKIIKLSCLGVVLFSIGYIFISYLGFARLSGDSVLSFFPPFIFIILAILFIISYIFLSLAFWYNKIENGKVRKIIIYLTLFISFASLLYGASELKKCDWKGCNYPQYLTDRALKEKTPEICELAKGQFNRDYCYGQLAEDNNNIELCKIIKEESSRSFCYTRLAENLKDISLCNLVTGNYMSQDTWEDKCIESVAIRTKDYNLCSKISNEGKGITKISCIMMVNRTQ